MITRIVQAVIVAVVVGFCLVVLLGPVLELLKVPIAVFIGNVFINWGWAMGIVAGLWFFFSGGSFGGWWRTPPP